MQLSSAEREHYAESGFVSGRPLLAPDEAARFLAACEATCAEEWRAEGRRQASNRVKPYLLYRWAADLIRHPRILDAVEQVIGPDSLAFHTTVWWKEPNSPNFVPWHQDGTYFGLEPYEHVTAWVALTPSTPDQYDSGEPASTIAP